MRLTIEWDANYNGVHIKTDTGLSLIVSGQPSMVMSWHDAVRFYKDNKVWQLPTREHLQLIAARIDEINAIIRARVRRVLCVVCRYGRWLRRQPR